MAALAVPAAAQVADRSALVEKLLPSVVEIHTRREIGKPEDRQPPRLQEATGSGFVISADGYIVTNRHVVDDAYDVSVRFTDGERLSAEVVGKGRTYDIALLKVTPVDPLSPVPFGNSDAVKVGQPVLVIGSPFGLGVTVTAGIVSALGRDLGLTHFDQFLQTDAAINHGNSGGPMFNLNGEVVGISTALYTPTNDGGFVGLGYAIPASDAAMLIPLLKEFGYLKAGSLGLYAKPMTEPVAQALGIAKQGVIVTSVAPGGPAGGNLVIGDVIVSIDGQAVNSLADYYRRVSAALARTIAVEIVRAGQRMQVPLVPTQWTEEAPVKAKPARAPVASNPATTRFGVEVAALNDANRRVYDLPPGRRGVVVTKVQPASPGAAAGLSVGDVIEEVQMRPVQTPAEAIAMAEQAAAQGRPFVIGLVRGPRDVRFVTIPLKGAMALR